MPSLSSRKRKVVLSTASPSPSAQRRRTSLTHTSDDPELASTSTATKVNDFTIHRLKGSSLPHFYDWVTVVVDDEGGQVVMYGGTTHAPSEVATNEFHILDVASMSWRSPKVTGHDRPATPLPILIKPANAIFKTSTGQRFMLLFGGVDSSGRTSSRLVSVDLDRMKWRYENVKGGKVLPRVNASMVAIKNRLYIFGGRDEISTEATLRRSYSIAECAGNEWTWVVTDVPYGSDEIQPATSGVKVIAIYDGAKILLGPGRRRSGETESINLNPDRWFVFHTRHRTFAAFCPLRGPIPDNAWWYWMYPVGATTDHSRSDDALIAAWVPYGTEELIPEIWRCNIDEETISCMDIRSHVWDLDLNLHGFVVCKGRFLLLGHDNVIYNDAGTQSTTGDGELVTTPIQDALYNVVVEINAEKVEPQVKVEDA